MVRILVVEDDEKMNRIICRYLSNAGYQPLACLHPMEAFDLLEDNSCHLVISDIMMPEMDGYEFAALLRERDAQLPILFVTALDDFASKQKGFRLGIDDYMVKPLDLDELVLRVGALLRRARIQDDNELVIGRLRMVQDEMTVYLDGQEMPVSPREFTILFKLLSYPRKIFTRSDLLEEYWGITSESGLRTVDVYVTRLRKTFADCDEFKIVTVHGFGYKAVLKEE